MIKLVHIFFSWTIKGSLLIVGLIYVDIAISPNRFIEKYQLASATIGIWTILSPSDSPNANHGTRLENINITLHGGCRKWWYPEHNSSIASPSERGVFLAQQKAACWRRYFWCYVFCWYVFCLPKKKKKTGSIAKHPIQSIGKTNRLLVRYKPSIRTKTNGFYKPFQTLQHKPSHPETLKKNDFFHPLETPC